MYWQHITLCPTTVPAQQFVYENGLGHFSHKGFGMLDVANASSIAKEENLEEKYA